MTRPRRLRHRDATADAARVDACASSRADARPTHQSNCDATALVTDVYERHASAIAAYALRRAAAADAADVVADTFLVAWRRHDEMPAEPQTLPWLYGVARRVLSNQRRSRDRRTRLHERLQHGFVEFEQQQDRIETADDVERVTAALHRLDDDDAELLRLTAWEGLSPQQIATAMELDSGVVRQRLRRARVRLRQRLESESGAAGTTGAAAAAANWRPASELFGPRLGPQLGTTWPTGTEG